MAEGRRLTQPVTPTDVAVLGRDLAGVFLQEHLSSSNEPVLIQCGHFSLIYDQHRGRFLPAVPGNAMVRDPFNFRAARAIGMFPVVSWDLGNVIALELQ